jgi:hypothetical protein
MGGSQQGPPIQFQPRENLPRRIALEGRMATDRRVHDCPCLHQLIGRQARPRQPLNHASEARGHVRDQAQHAIHRERVVLLPTGEQRGAFLGRPGDGKDML